MPDEKFDPAAASWRQRAAAQALMKLGSGVVKARPAPGKLIPISDRDMKSKIDPRLRPDQRGNTGQITFVIADKSGAIVRQGYCASDDLAKQPQADKGEVTAIRTRGIVDISRYRIDAQAGALIENPPVVTPDQAIETADDGVMTIDAAPGTIAILNGKQEFRESGGKLTVTFPAGGGHHLRIQAPGRKSWSGRIKVTTASDARQDAAKEINADRDSEIGRPIDIGGGRPIDSGKESQLAFTMAAFAAQSTGQATEWVLTDNSTVSLTPAEMAAGVAAMAARNAEAVRRGRAAKDKLAPAATPEAVRKARSFPQGQ